MVKNAYSSPSAILECEPTPSTAASTGYRITSGSAFRPVGTDSYARRSSRDEPTSTSIGSASSAAIPNATAVSASVVPAGSSSFDGSPANLVSARHTSPTGGSSSATAPVPASSENRRWGTAA